MQKITVKYYLTALLLAVLLIGGITWSVYERSSSRRRVVCLKELNHVLSCVHSPLDFETFASPLKKNMAYLANLIIKDVKGQGAYFEPDQYTQELIAHLKRIHELAGGRAWLEEGQRQALFRLHEALSTEAQESQY